MSYVDKSETGLSYRIQRSRLEGTVRVSGAKNSVLRLLAASLLTPEPVVIENYPASMLDARIHVGMLEKLGKRCVVSPDRIEISQTTPPLSELDWPGRSIRNTLLILGALVARTGHGAVPVPGGCALGSGGDRKWDLHEMLLTKLGARVYADDQDRLAAEAPNGLTGADIELPIRSTGATENAMIAGSLARGTTRIWNPHVKPEMLDLVRFLNGIGARITVHGSEHIEVQGVGEMGEVRHTVVPDNLEALTWFMGAVVTGGDVEILDFPLEDLEVPLIYLRESGARFYRGDRSVIVRGGRPYPVEIATGPYPGIFSDMQPFFAVYAACARGTSKIVDLRFQDRYGYAAELARMGMDSVQKGDLLVIRGGKPLQGAEVKALDLRAGVACTLAGLVADGVTTVRDAWQVERGYDHFVAKLQGLGGSIESQEGR